MLIMDRISAKLANDVIMRQSVTALRRDSHFQKLLGCDHYINTVNDICAWLLHASA